MEKESIWEAPPELPFLGKDEVHVWRACLEAPAAQLGKLAGLLCEAERTRAARFVTEEHGNHFRVARGVLRQLLGRYLNAAPQELVFTYGAYGKPALTGEVAHYGLRFNLSHSHRLALCAVTRDREVGVDLEFLRSRVDVEGLAQRFFSPLEVDRLMRLPRALRPAGFYRCWTRKEAYLKARGEGITVPLDGFAVSLEADEPARLLHCRCDPDEPARWRLQALNPAPGYAAAVCAPGTDWTLACWAWSHR